MALEELPAGRLRRAMRARAKRLARCGTVVGVRSCSTCSTPRAGTGVLQSAGTRCESRSCPACARARSADVRSWLSDAMHGAHLRAQHAGASGSGLKWRHITLTLGRDVADPAQHTWQLLRARAKALQAAWREVWRAWRTLPGASALLTLEIAGSGHVHAHALVLGPRSVAKSWISEIVGRHGVGCSNSGDAPHVDVRTVEHAQAAKELSKYHAKMPSVRLESWLGGWPATTLHPTIAARWELASYGTRLMERYGGLREALEDAPAELPTISAADTASDDARARCQCCGTVGRWEWSRWRGSVAAWVNYCRARGSPALAESTAWEAATSSAQAAHLERDEMRRARRVAAYLRADAAAAFIASGR